MNAAKSWRRSQRMRTAGGLLLGLAAVAAVTGMAQYGAGVPRRLALMPAAAEEDSFHRAAKKKYSADELRKRYPFESLTARLEYERAHAKADAKHPTPDLSYQAAERLRKMEQAFGGPQWWSNLRAESLKQLHSNKVEEFISREGFGVSRIPLPAPEFLELAEASPIPFTASGARPPAEKAIGPKIPLARGDEAGPAELMKPDALMPSLAQLDMFHLRGQMNFINTASLGYIKDREHVAGFQAHQFRTIPQLVDPAITREKTPRKEKWAVARLELVSLLKHEKPAIYISETLPRMEQLKEAKTRPLDDFEANALQRLQKGEDVVTESSLNQIRMMGSLRAARQCMQCHSAKRGELLGSFSYVLQRVPPRTPVE
jgi:hypothetical protein